MVVGQGRGDSGDREGPQRKEQVGFPGSQLRAPVRAPSQQPQTALC